jgi:hypothetical protein
MDEKALGQQMMGSCGNAGVGRAQTRDMLEGGVQGERRYSEEEVRLRERDAFLAGRKGSANKPCCFRVDKPCMLCEAEARNLYPITRKVPRSKMIGGVLCRVAEEGTRGLPGRPAIVVNADRSPATVANPAFYGSELQEMLELLANPYTVEEV